MDAELIDALREIGRHEKQAHKARRALRALKDALGRRLGSYTLAAGEHFNEREVLDFLRLAIGSTAQQEVQITVTAHSGTDTQGETP